MESQKYARNMTQRMCSLRKGSSGLHSGTYIYLQYSDERHWHEWSDTYGIRNWGNIIKKYYNNQSVHSWKLNALEFRKNLTPS